MRVEFAAISGEEEQSCGLGHLPIDTRIKDAKPAGLTVSADGEAKPDTLSNVSVPPFAEENTFRDSGQDPSGIHPGSSAIPECTSSAGVEGHLIGGAHLVNALAPADNESFRDAGQRTNVAHGTGVIVSEGADSASEGGPVSLDIHCGDVSPLAETIAAIRAAHRERVFWMEQRKRSDLSLGAYLRSALGWSLNKPVAERKAIAAQAQDILAAGEKYIKAMRRAQGAMERRKNYVEIPEMPDILRRFGHIVVPQIEMRGRIDELEAAATKAMVALAQQLPVATWATSIRGFGPLSLAIVVGEAGDLGGYANPGKLWKRMGVAVINGVRQGGLSKGAPRAEWEAHGYNPSRRSRLYTIGSSMVMSGDPKPGSNEVSYRQVYLDRKAYEAARAEADGLIVAPSAKIPKSKQGEYRSLGHIDNRARRYLEKRVLRDLWREWRRAGSVN